MELQQRRHVPVPGSCEAGPGGAFSAAKETDLTGTQGTHWPDTEPGRGTERHLSGASWLEPGTKNPV